MYAGKIKVQLESLDRAEALELIREELDGYNAYMIEHMNAQPPLSKFERATITTYLMAKIAVVPDDDQVRDTPVAPPPAPLGAGGGPV